MKRNELTIAVSLAVIVLIAAFWLVALSPKRERATSLKQDVDQLHSQFEQAQQAVAAGEQQRKSFPTDYRRLVVLGKAVPEDGDQAGLLVQLQRLADRAGVRFQALNLSVSTGATTSTSSAPPTSTSSTETASASSSVSSESPPSEAPPETAVAATEASAATVPIGASVGPAGLPVMPYQLRFTGGFFQIADFLESLDGLVHLRQGVIDVHGRLLTVDGFSLQPSDSEAAGQTGDVSPIPTLAADLSVTTYLTPGDQGLTAGADPSGPAPATPAPATPTPASTTTPTSSTPPASPTP